MSHTARAPRAIDAPLDRSRRQAIARRDPTAEGAFVYGVVTTGVYCRPTCGARLPRPENIRLFAGPDEAEAAGFRACLRCRPRGPSAQAQQAALVARTKTALEGEEAPGLAALAAEAGVSPYHLHRLFKRHVGLTPRAYAAAHRLRRAARALRGGATVTAAIHDAGYGSAARFYAGASGALGMTPAAARRGGAGSEIRFAVRPCALGLVLVAATARGVCAVAFADEAAALAAELRARFPRATIAPAEGADAGFEALVERVLGLVEAPDRPADLPLDLIGTAFQLRVWQALRETPGGTTTTYGALARRLGTPAAARAVGAACGANPVAVAVPCHRAVAADGRLVGYRWGLERKRALLARERTRR